MKIVVCIKAVPDPEHYDNVRLDPVSKTVVRDSIDQVLNGADKHAIELAMQLKENEPGTEVTLISMGPESVLPQIREGLSYGCDRGVLLSDRAFGGADALATAYTLVQGIKKTGPYDLILTGAASEDGATAHVPSQIGVLMGIPHITDVRSCERSEEGLTVSKEFESETITYAVGLPAVIGVDRRINKVRLPNVMGIFQAKNKPMEIITAADLKEADESRFGLRGSFTQNGDLMDPESGRECAELGDAAELLNVISAGGAQR